jgi:hypothetical protein
VVSRASTRVVLYLVNQSNPTITSVKTVRGKTEKEGKKEKGGK